MEDQSDQTNGQPIRRPPSSIFLLLVQPWVWRMAWRDTRSSRRRMLFFSTSIMFGIAALVAIGSFGHNLRRNVDLQTRTLVGADLVVTSRQPFSDEEWKTLAAAGGELAKEVSFSSMVFFSKGEQTRLIQVRAVEGGFPFYGELQTEPASAVAEFRQGRGVLVEASVLGQFGIKPGDRVRLGEWETTVAGSLLDVPGANIAFEMLAPTVFVPLEDLEKTKLLQTRSLSRHHAYFKIDDSLTVPVLSGRVLKGISRRLQFDTVERRKRQLGNALENLYRFLSLTGFVALLLGAVGTASAIRVHVKQKLPTVATLRCLGCSVKQTFAIYLIQTVALGLVGTLMGTALGLVVQYLLPFAVAGVVPFEIQVSVAWPAVFRAMGIGLGVSILFALAPLLAVRRVTPLATIRAEYENGVGGRFDPLAWLVYLAIGAAILAFAISQTQRREQGIGFAIAVGIVLLLLAGLAKLIVVVARRWIPKTLPYVWRQGLANLYRPNNRTVLFMVSLGLGTFLVLSLFLTQHVLVTKLFPMQKANTPNAILFEVYPDQKEEIIALMNSMKLPVLQDVSIVNMKLAAIKGVPVSELRRNRGQARVKGRGRRRTPGWVTGRQYRSTYRDHLEDSEELVAGELHGPFTGGIDDVIPVSVEKDIADDMGVTLGDELEWDVQGMLIKTRVTSLRKVDWRRVQPNFFVVFPTGALEEAPGQHILTTHVEDSEESAALQREVVKRFPNVSAIDLTFIIKTLDGIIDRVTFVIQFMAMFTVATGLLVLVGTVMTGKYQRIKESILLRTLGASRRQVQQILLSEYLFLGLFAGLTGALLAIAGSWALAKFMFKIDYSLAVVPLLIALALVSALTVVTGLIANRGVVTHPPLEILRSEGG
ncbi:MAG: putative ABC transport system permease protein [Limisphaerales bacterium]|jgi:putative ABC transport system permease protein